MQSHSDCSANLPDVRDSPVHPTADEMRWLYATVEWVRGSGNPTADALDAKACWCWYPWPVGQSMCVWSWYGHDTSKADLVAESQVSQPDGSYTTENGRPTTADD